VQVVGVEVLVGGRGGEEEVEEFEDEELGAEGGFAVEEENEVFAEGAVGGAVGGEEFEDAVGG